MSTTTIKEVDGQQPHKPKRGKEKVEELIEVVPEEPTETTTEEVQETPSEKVKSEGVLIYVGPTTKQLTRYASFVGGLPTHMDEHFENCKVLKRLFIDTKDFGEFEQGLLDASSVETMLFNKVQQYFSEVK